MPRFYKHNSNCPWYMSEYGGMCQGTGEYDVDQVEMDYNLCDFEKCPIYYWLKLAEDEKE